MINESIMWLVSESETNAVKWRDKYFSVNWRVIRRDHIRGSELFLMSLPERYYREKFRVTHASDEDHRKWGVLNIPILSERQ